MLDEFHYQLSWRPRGYAPGHHRGARSGSGQEFVGHVPLLAAPDARRIDVRATLCDLFGSWLVRTHLQRTDIRVFLVADLSASMGVAGSHSKMDTLADFAASVAYSAHRTGDRYGFLGFDIAVRRDPYLAPTRARGAGLELADRLRSFVPDGRGAEGLLSVPDHLGPQRALVFLVSDFHFPMPLLDQALQQLARHDVVPAVLWDRIESGPLPRFGITQLYDAEIGDRRTVLWRPALCVRWLQASARRREELTRCFFRHGRKALFVDRGFGADALTDYFFSGTNSVA